MVKLKNKRIFRVLKVNWQCKDHNSKECCSYLIPKGTEKRILTIGFLTFCLCTFTFEVFLELFSFSFHAFAKIKIRFVTHFRPPLYQ